MLDTAQRLFLSNGFSATTIASIAADADVSVETIYKAFGGKRGLVRAIWDQGLDGSGARPAWRRSDEMQMLEADPRKVIEGWSILAAEVAPRATPILLLIHAAAATDPEMAALQREVDEARLTRMENNARHLYDRGAFRRDITLEHARDVMWSYSSPEVYELLVLRRGWPLERYSHFIADGMIGSLLPGVGQASAAGPR
ncbi:MAG TPA: TetR/AcrR family transcriptional regulator [Candidatus Dormibacteraeota bacterium]|nr:TetR/AcrR family transcriptional regulator [Candidatus Dormibacteraeota bacterium]